MKGPTVTISHFPGHAVSGRAIQLCPHSTNEGPDNAKQKPVTGSQQNLFAKTGRVELARPCSKEMGAVWAGSGGETSGESAEG